MHELGLRKQGPWRRWSGRAVLGLLAVAGLASLVTLAETNVWWVRYLDFVRLQLVIAMLLMLAALAALRPRLGALGMAALLLGLGGLAYHLYRVHPYLPVFARQVPATDACEPPARLRIMVANVQRDNQLAQAFIQLVARVRPDVLVVMETDPWWDEHLVALRSDFSQVVQAIPGRDSFYGMHVFSRYELVSPEFKYLFGADTPMLSSGLRLPDGRLVRLHALHPRPPQAWSQPTTARDGQLMHVALQARGENDPVIVAGDFNAVPWERVVRRAMRVGELLDPRLGRGVLPTYKVGSLLQSWPLDQILFSRRFALLDWGRLPAFGSDHYAVSAQLCLLPQSAAHPEAPALHAGDLDEAKTAIEAAAALDE
ncbi:endonuclease/exonuclease/phosphatase family protein [Ramlibacter sp. AW1]|uniref:Endonuclease/exonuclease/phosphatase family protein n=1 Tax=Ramlibacter aurantiacus TaxID=2801330 RepID=A0A937D190_9BURK|nr:endonuclease/exonuclease/phosphatase family protein [Ramlibacter aurantiacus]MBL0420274.1 endonuclease/exonuclease/phosphatase family protein [Ramlibacter aurantiacus]